MQRFRNFSEAVEAIMRDRPQYTREAYDHMIVAMDKTSEQLAKQENGNKHLTAEELFFGFCACAIDEYGPMAHAVLEFWGVRDAKDVGQIVYNLIEVGVFGKQKEDSQEEFDCLPDMKQLLRVAYLPESEQNLEMPAPKKKTQAKKKASTAKKPAAKKTAAKTPAEKKPTAPKKAAPRKKKDKPKEE